jgi:flavin reductase (DIM6/NTAB) family NADH-FMN oxidoreductase RutF
METIGPTGLAGGCPDVTADQFRDAMGRWPTGVAVVTTAAEDLPAGCTVNAMTTVSLTPPLLVVSLAAGSWTLTAIQAHGRFGVNVLPASRSELGQRFAMSSREERFRGVDFAWVLAVPLLSDVLVRGVCTVERQLAVADHVLVIGRTVLLETVDRAPGVDSDPSVRFRRSYWGLSGLGAPAGTPPPEVLANGNRKG